MVVNRHLVKTRMYELISVEGQPTPAKMVGSDEKGRFSSSRISGKHFLPSDYYSYSRQLTAVPSVFDFPISRR